MTAPGAPLPNGNYVVARRHRDVIFTSGMTPRENGVLVFTGKVMPDDPLETHKAALVLSTANAVDAARRLLDEGEHVSQVLNLNVFVAADPSFQDHSRLADFASDYLQEQFGNAGIGTRAAIGVASLPGDARVEIQLMLAVEGSDSTASAG